MQSIFPPCAFPSSLTLAQLSGLHAAPMEKAIAPCKDCLVEVTDPPSFSCLATLFHQQPIADRVMGGEDPAAAEAGAEIDLLEDEDEAVGDRIMEVGGKDSLLTILKKTDLLGNLTR